MHVVYILDQTGGNRDMKSETYKPFSQQYRECRENGNLIPDIEDATNIKDSARPWCIKHNCFCSSIVCLNERTGNE